MRAYRTYHKVLDRLAMKASMNHVLRAICKRKDKDVRMSIMLIVLILNDWVSAGFCFLPQELCMYQVTRFFDGEI